jgi:hypothetical protein
MAASADYAGQQVARGFGINSAAHASTAKRDDESLRVAQEQLQLLKEIRDGQKTNPTPDQARAAARYAAQGGSAIGW